MSTRRCYAKLGAITLDLILDTSRLARLRIDQLHIRNIDVRLLVDNATAAIALWVGPLMAFDHPYAFNLDLGVPGQHFQNPASLALITTGDDHHLIILLNL